VSPLSLSRSCGAALRRDLIFGCGDAVAQNLDEAPHDDCGVFYMYHAEERLWIRFTIDETEAFSRGFGGYCRKRRCYACAGAKRHAPV